MLINIYEEKFISVNDILLVKTYVKRLSEYRLDNDSLCGSVLVDLSFFDTNMDENFKQLELPYAIVLKNDMKVNSVNLGEVLLEVVDQKGVIVKFNLDLDYDLYEDILNGEIVEEPIENPIILGVINNQIDKENKEEIINENLKEIISDNYDEMLNESLKTRSDNISIIETKETKSVDDFLDFFNQFEANYLRIKKTIVKPEEIKNYLIKNGLPMEYEYSNYDKENGILTTYIYE